MYASVLRSMQLVPNPLPTPFATRARHGCSRERSCALRAGGAARAAGANSDGAVGPCARSGTWVFSICGGLSSICFIWHGPNSGHARVVRPATSGWQCTLSMWLCLKTASMRRNISRLRACVQERSRAHFFAHARITPLVLPVHGSHRFDTGLKLPFLSITKDLGGMG